MLGNVSLPGTALDRVLLLTRDGSGLLQVVGHVGDTTDVLAMVAGALCAVRNEVSDGAQPLGNPVLRTPESHPSMTTVGRRSESEQSSSSSLTLSPSASDTGHAGTGTVLRSQSPITPDAWRQAAGSLQELLPTVVPLGKLRQASVPLQELSPTVTQGDRIILRRLPPL